MRTKFLLFVIPVLILLIISFLVWIVSANSTDIEKDIKSQELSYTCNCGWVNWGHALPEGVTPLINEIVKDSSIGTKEVVYTQKMKVNFIFGSRIVAEISRKYKIIKSPIQKEREAIAWTIFKQTSEGFEKMQNSFPFSISMSSRNSSYKEGDLMGDQIAFYRALRGFTEEDICRLCRPLSVQESLGLYKEGKFGTSYQWFPHLWKPNGMYPTELNSVNLDSNLNTQNLIFIKETKNIYLEF